MRRPIHRIRAAHGCEHLRYASDPSNKECALRRLPRPRAVGIVRRGAEKAGKLILSSTRSEAMGAKQPSVTSRPSSALGGVEFLPATTGMSANCANATPASVRSRRQAAIADGGRGPRGWSEPSHSPRTQQGLVAPKRSFLGRETRLVQGQFPLQLVIRATGAQENLASEYLPVRLLYRSNSASTGDGGFQRDFSLVNVLLYAQSKLR